MPQLGPQVRRDTPCIINMTAQQFVSIWFIALPRHTESHCSQAKMGISLFKKKTPKKPHHLLSHKLTEI